jgi:hypothetical protein
MEVGQGLNWDCSAKKKKYKAKHHNHQDNHYVIFALFHSRSRENWNRRLKAKAVSHICAYLGQWFSTLWDRGPVNCFFIRRGPGIIETRARYRAAAQRLRNTELGDTDWRRLRYTFQLIFIFFKYISLLFDFSCYRIQAAYKMTRYRPTWVVDGQFITTKRNFHYVNIHGSTDLRQHGRGRTSWKPFRHFDLTSGIRSSTTPKVTLYTLRPTGLQMDGLCLRRINKIMTDSYPEWSCLWFSSVPPKAYECWKRTLNMRQTFPSFFKFIGNKL